MNDLDLAKSIAKDLLEAAKRDPKLKETASAAARLVASLAKKSDRQSADAACQTAVPPISPPSSSSGQSVSQSINGTSHSSTGASTSMQTPQRVANSTSGATPFLRLLGNSTRSARANHRFHPYGVTINPQVFPSTNIPCPVSPCATETVSDNAHGLLLHLYKSHGWTLPSAKMKLICMACSIGRPTCTNKDHAHLHNLCASPTRLEKL